MKCKDCGRNTKKNHYSPDFSELFAIACVGNLSNIDKTIQCNKCSWGWFISPFIKFEEGVKE